MIVSIPDIWLTYFEYASFELVVLKTTIKDALYCLLLAQGRFLIVFIPGEVPILNLNERL